MSETAPETAGATLGGERPKVVAVVLTWNDVDLTRNCLMSLRECAYEPFEVVVVDNGSDFPVVPVLAEEFPEADIVALPENTGFTGGCNRGMERALERGADYVFLLNNDTLVDRDAAGELVAALEDRPDVGMASALLLNPAEHKEVFFHKATVDRNRGWTYRVDESVPFAERHEGVCESEFLIACAVMFPAKALREVGMFDERLFTNWEDYDLCMRLRDAGWRLVTAGSAEVIHLISQTTGSTSPFITYLSVRNRLKCIGRYASFGGILRNSVFILRSLTWQMRGYGLNSWECHRAFFKGIAHALIGVEGKGGTPANRKNARTRG